MGAFAIICSLWYFHHLLFKNFFVAKALPVVLNFVWLAVVVLLVFVAVKLPATDFGYRNLDMLYFALYALAYGILALQTLIAVREHAVWEDGQRLRAIRNISFMSYWCIVFLTCFLLVALLPPTAGAGNAILATFLVGIAGSTLMGVYFRRYRSRVSHA